MVNELHAAARAWAAQGFSIFPCRPGTKEPANYNGHHGATTDLDQIDRWWSENPDYNIGVVPGSAGCLVVDIDCKDGSQGYDTWRRLEELQDYIPHTLQVDTPSGGEHLWFSSSLRSGKSPGTGIDIKAATGYVLVPPSRTDAGSYTWLSHAPIAALPAWLHRLVEKAPEASRRATGNIELDTPLAIQEAIQHLNRIPTWGPDEPGDDFWSACEVLDYGVSAEQGIELAIDAGADRDWATLQFTNAAVYKQNEDGSKIPQSGAEILTDALPTYGRLIRHTPGPVKELIEGLLERNRMAYLIGGDSLHKSRIAAQWGLSVHTGKPVWGRRVEQAHFIHLSWENGFDEDSRRAHKILDRLNIEPDQASSANYIDMLDATEPLLHIGDSGIMPTPTWSIVLELARAIPGHKFMVIDSAYNAMWFHGQAKLDEGLVRATVNWWDSQCKHLDMTGLILQHPSRTARNTGGTAGYSQAWDAAPRVRLSIEGKNLPNHYVLTVAKRNNAAQGEKWELAWDDGIIVNKGDGVMPDKMHDSALGAVCKMAVEYANTGQPLQRRSRIYDHHILSVVSLGGPALSSKAIHASLTELELAGRLVYQSNDAGGRGAKAGYYEA